jgi:mannose-6-phosphate isomerase-like protein (cupin superfamily)
MVMTATQRKRGISIYRAAEAVDLAETDFMLSPLTPDGSAHTISETIDADAAAGAQLKVLVRDAGGFSLLYIWFKANYPLPRHSHNVDCMYYVISGSAIMGSQVLRSGDSFFVPAGAPYQYSAGIDGVEVLEIRYGAKQFDIELATNRDLFRTMAATMAANRDRWLQEPTSPTFAANAG